VPAAPSLDPAAVPGMRTGAVAELPREPMVRAAVAPTGWLARRAARPNWFPLPLLPAMDAVGFSALLSSLAWALLLIVSFAGAALLVSVSLLRGRLAISPLLVPATGEHHAHRGQRNGSTTLRVDR
jgi:hypothetical protein